MSEPVKEKSTVKNKKLPKKKVALYSSKNLHIGLESLSEGFNIVSEDKAEQWLISPAVRIANPEEVASAYGK